MLRATMGALSVAIGLAGTAMAGQRIIISSAWGQVRAELAENKTAEALADMLPLTIEMSDHLRQEKTGNLPSSLPSSPRQRDFFTGTIGLWSSGDFVIYYRDGQVPSPGIVILGKITGDVSIFDRPGAVKVKVEAAQ